MFSFERVTERDVDSVIMRSIAELPEFAALFLNCTKWSGAKIICIKHSLTDIRYGESDITVIIEKDNMRYGLLIENKIDAEAMPDQCQRYFNRGWKGVESGDYADFAVFITAPQKYLDENIEAMKYPHKISYENMRQVFSDAERFFDQELIECAIEKSRVGYVVEEVPAVTNFWNQLYDYSLQSSYDIKMYPPNGAKGARASWLQFRVLLAGTSLLFKSRDGFVDLEFSGRAAESLRLKKELEKLKTADMHWVITGKSICLRLKAETIDFYDDFSECITKIDDMFCKVEQMTKFAAVLNDSGFRV